MSAGSVVTGFEDCPVYAPWWSNPVRLFHMRGIFFGHSLCNQRSHCKHVLRQLQGTLVCGRSDDKAYHSEESWLPRVPLGMAQSTTLHMQRIS